MLSELKEGKVEVEPQVDGLLARVPHVGEMLEGDQRLLKRRHGLPRGRARKRLHASLMEVRDGFLPHLAPERVVGEPFDLLGQAVGNDCLERRDDAGMV